MKRVKYLRAAGSAPNYIRGIVASKSTPKKRARWESRKLGKFGAASEVRHIDPSTYRPAK